MKICTYLTVSIGRTTCIWASAFLFIGHLRFSSLFNYASIRWPLSVNCGIVYEPEYCFHILLPLTDTNLYKRHNVHSYPAISVYRFRALYSWQDRVFRIIRSLYTYRLRKKPCQNPYKGYIGS